MLYPELEKYLEANHFYFSKEITVGKGGEVCTGLSCYVPPIISSMRMERLKEVLPEGFNANYFPNTQTIRIEKI